MFFVSRRNLAPLIGLLAATRPFDGWAAAPASTDPSGLVTILDGEAFLLRGTERFALAEGAAVRPDDMIHVPEGAKLLRLEMRDQTSLAFGPGSRALLAPRLGGDRTGAIAYLLHGWLKVTAPKGSRSTLLSTPLDAMVAGSAVMALEPGTARVFAENGESTVRLPNSVAKVLRPGEFLQVLGGTDAEAQPGVRPTQSFLQALPRSFMETIPPRADRFRDRNAEPKPLGPVAYTDAQPWIDVDAPALRRAYMARWRPLLRDPGFRRSLAAGLKAHPEWEPVLFPSAQKRNAS